MARANTSVVKRGALSVSALAALALTVLVVGPGTPQVSAAPVTVNYTCTPDETPTQHGSTLISGPIATQISSTPLDLSIPGDFTATPSVPPGGLIAYNGTFNIDLQTKVDEILTNQVKPGIASAPGGSPALAATAFLNLTMADTTANVPLGTALPSGNDTTINTILGTPVATSTGPAVTAGTTGTPVDNVFIKVTDPLQAGSYSGQPGGASTTSTTFPAATPFSISLNYFANATGALNGDSIEVHPGNLTFTMTFDVGVYFFTSLITGGVDVPMTCTPEDPDQILAVTNVDSQAPTTSASLPTTTTSTTSTTTTTTTSSSSTTASSTTSTTSTTSSTSSSSSSSSTTSTTQRPTTTRRSTTSTTSPTQLLDFTLSPNPAPLGTPVTVSGSGCPANSSINLTFNGSQMATSTANSSGSFSFVWTPPLSLPAGTGPLTLSCGGRSVTHQYTVTSAANTTTTTSGTLPVTGDNPNGLLIAGIVLIGGGAALSFLARGRRRNAEIG